MAQEIGGEWESLCLRVRRSDSTVLSSHVLSERLAETRGLPSATPEINRTPTMGTPRNSPLQGVDSPASCSAAFEELGRWIYAKVTDHVASGEGDEWCEEVMERAHKLGLALWETYEPEKHGSMDAEAGEDFIWWWGHLPVGWQSSRSAVEFVGIDGKPETDPNKCGFLRINNPAALREPNDEMTSPRPTPSDD
jgi:hypothetical protein